MDIGPEYPAKIKELFYIQTVYYPEMWISKRSEKTGYSPACANKHTTPCKENNYQCADCQTRKLIALTDDTIIAHLQGKITLGTYQVYDDQVKWLCLDFDIEDESARGNAMEMARLTQAELAHLNVPCYLEDSGNKGYHLWVFFSAPVLATMAQDLGARLMHKINSEQEFSGVNEVEIFPKQTRVTESDFGNLVKLPFGVHKKTGRRCLFLDESGNPHQNQRSFLLNTETLAADDLPAIIAEFEPVARSKKTTESSQVNDIIPQGDRDKTLTSVAGTMRRRGMTADEIEVALQAINQRRCDPPLDEKDIQKIARSVSRYEPDAQGTVDNSPHYKLTEDGIVYVKAKPIYKRGTGEILDWDEVEYPVCNFSLGIASELRSCDGEDTENMFSIAGRTTDRPFQFDIAAEELADQRKLQATLLVHAGGRGIVYAGQMKHMLPALQCLSNGYEREVRYVSTGWQKVADQWIFVTPGGGVGVDMVRCDVAAELRNYRVVGGNGDLEQGLRALHYLMESFGHNITYPSIAHAFLGPLIRYLPNVKRYCLHLTGETGSLKTTFATLLLCLYGDFGNEDPTAKFGSTINSIEGLGHQAKDVLFVVDDFKPRYVKLDDITRLIQGYSDGHGRGRMNRNSTLQATKYVRGVLLTTGEDVPEHEASIIARSLILKMSRWDGRNDNLAKAAELSNALPHVMGRFISYLLNADMSDLERLVTEKRDQFLIALSGQGVTNAGRIATNAAQNWLAFYYLCGWLGYIDEWSETVIAHNMQEHESILLALCGEMARRITDEKASTTFIDAIRSLLDSEQAVLMDRASAEAVPYGKTMLGWKDDTGIYMQAGVAFHAVELWLRQVGKSIGFNAGAVWDQLEADGLLLNRRAKIRTGSGGLQQKMTFHFAPDLLIPGEGDDELDF